MICQSGMANCLFLWCYSFFVWIGVSLTLDSFFAIFQDNLFDVFPNGCSMLIHICDSKYLSLHCVCDVVKNSLMKDAPAQTKKTNKKSSFNSLHLICVCICPLLIFYIYILLFLLFVLFMCKLKWKRRMKKLKRNHKCFKLESDKRRRNRKTRWELGKGHFHFDQFLTQRWISTCPFGHRNGNDIQEKSYSAKRERENNKVNKEVFDWLLKNNKNAAFAKISRSNWLTLGIPVRVQEKSWTQFNFFSGTNGKVNSPVGEHVITFPEKWKSALNATCWIY